jgi:hypothetical protein
MKTRLLLFIISVGISSNVFGEDVFLLRFHSTVRKDACHSVTWTGDARLLNQNSVPVEAKLVDMSDGGVLPGTQRFLTLPPGEVISVMTQGPSGWAPSVQDTTYALWVLHLDVPSGVLLENRDEVAALNDCVGPTPPTSITKIPLPAVRALVPAGVPQTKLGTDLGLRASHQNVAVYNDGLQIAVAHIEVRRSCDNTIAAQRDVTVDPKSIIQVNGIPVGTNTCSSSLLSAHERYTVVVVDQPSFSIVSSVADDVLGQDSALRVDLATH